MLELVATFLVKTTVILGMANAACSIRGLSAAERHAAACIGVLGVAMVGVFACLPAWTVPVPALPAGDLAESGLPPSSESSAASAGFSEPSASSREASVGGWLLTVYAATVLVLGTGSIRRYLRIARRVRALPARRSTGPNGIEILVDACTTPWTWGLRRPVIVIPPGFDGWSAKRQEAAIAHEMGHIRRRDWVIDLVSEWLCIIFWFQPLIWITWRRQRGYAERACDDVVLAGGGDECDYAEALLAVARENGAPRHSERWPMGMAGGPGALSVRIESVLQMDARRRPMTSTKRWAFAMLGVTIALPLGTAAVTATRDADPFEPTDAQAAFLDRPGLGWHGSLDSRELAVTGCCTCHVSQTVTVRVQGTVPAAAWALADADRGKTTNSGESNQRPAVTASGPAC
ncbi:MAG: M56 family metallopeptidase [Gammaproteobacteria bacterium]|nr:M56 family metallopeptidase [Gammaproteobacteria bacterium]